MKKRKKYVKKLKNVIILSPKHTFIEKGAQIGTGTIIYPNNYIENGAKIGKNCVLYPNNYIKNSEVGDNCYIGPCSHIRENSILGNGVRFGNFCEIKNSSVGERTKISHLTYIGDGVVGKNCNFGCGTIFANFNGKIKQKITIGDDCFIGCNTNLIAPITIGKNTFVAAGSTVGQDLPENTFAISRAELKISQNKNMKAEK